MLIRIRSLKDHVTIEHVILPFIIQPFPELYLDFKTGTCSSLLGGTR